MVPDYHWPPIWPTCVHGPLQRLPAPSVVLSVSVTSCWDAGGELTLAVCIVTPGRLTLRDLGTRDIRNVHTHNAARNSATPSIAKVDFVPHPSCSHTIGLDKRVV